MSLAKEGFTITFTQPIDPASAADVKSWNLSTWHYKYGRQYGSPDLDKQAAKITVVKLSPDHTQATLSVEDLHDRQWIYYLVADGVKTPAGEALRNKEAYYTLNRLRN
jgi:hypothetical protein